jgi:hypothetical protein
MKWFAGSVRGQPARRMGYAVLIGLLSALLLSCGSSKEPSGVQVVLVTATFTPGSAVQVVTATFTPEATAAGEQATYTPYPTYTPFPTFTPMLPDTPLPPTDTPLPTFTAPPPTNTPRPAAAATQKPAATQPAAKAYAPPVLVSPEPNYNCYTNRGCTFSWTWGGSLKANEYFQVQLVGPGNEHRGIHPPTKGTSFTSTEDVYLIITDWCNKDYFCSMKWTVAIVEWDGKDPGKIGRTIVEAQWREVTL